MHIDIDLLKSSFAILWVIYFSIMIISSVREFIKKNNKISNITTSSVIRSIKNGFKNVLLAILITIILVIIPTSIIYIILKYVF